MLSFLASLHLEQVIDHNPRIVDVDLPLLTAIAQWNTAEEGETGTESNSLLLVTQHDRLVGVLTERDALRCLASSQGLPSHSLPSHSLHVMTVGMAMSPAKGVLALPDLQERSPHSPNLQLLAELHQHFQQHKVQQVPLVDAAQRVVGLLTLQRLWQAIDLAAIDTQMQGLQQHVVQLEADRVSLIDHCTLQTQQQLNRKALIHTIALRIRKSLHLQTTLQAIVTEVRQFLQTDRVLVYRFAPDMSGTIVAESVGEPWIPILGVHIEDTCFQTGAGETYRQGHKRAIDNIYEAGLTDCHLRLLERFQVQANLVVPILLSHSLDKTEPDPPYLWGLLVAHHCAEPRNWQTTDLELLDQLAVQIAIAIQQAQLFEQTRLELTERQQAESALQVLNQELEQRVHYRTSQLADLNQQLQTEIAERRQAETALRDSEEQFRKIFENAPIGIAIIDPYDRYFLRVNQTFIDDTGYTPQELIHYRIEDITHPEDVGSDLHLSEQLLKGTILSYNLEKRYLHKNHAVRWVNLTATMLRDAQGNPLYRLGMVEDITERKQAEYALRTSEAKFQRLAANVPGVIYQYVLRADGSEAFVYMSPRCRDVLELEPDEVQQDFDRIWSMIHPDDQLAIRLSLADSADTLQPWFAEFRLITPSGLLKWLRGDSQPEQLDNGDILWDGILSDISDRKQAEAAMHQQVERERLFLLITQRIRESLDLEAILRTTVAEIRQVLRVDRVLVYRIFPDRTAMTIAESVDANTAAALGIHLAPEPFPNDLYNRYLQGDICVLSDSAPTGSSPSLIHLTHFLSEMRVRARLTVPIVQNNTLWGLLIAHQCDQPRHWQPWEITLLQNLANQLAIAIQQSELYQQVQTELYQREQALAQRQRAEEKLRQTNEQLALANAELARATRLKDEFLANMSHELRTPLNSILGLSEALQDQVFGSINDKQRQFLSTIQDSGRHLLELINDILDLAKIEAGKLDLQLSTVAVHSLCEASLNFIKQQALQKEITLDAEIAAGLGDIYVDERRMRQVLINLLSNAVKFTPPRGRVTLMATGDRTQQTVTFHIVDTGIGIAEADMGKLFQAFVQIDSSLARRYEGTGLGLVLVKRLVELHDGQVWVKSELGQGSCFTVVVPWKREVLDEWSGESIVEADLCLAPLLNPLNSNSHIATHPIAPLILLAEDNADNVATLKDYLEVRGFRVVVAKNGTEVIEMTRNQQPDLILMDVQMPNRTGLEATQELRADRATQTIPIIALTALAMPGDREKCLAAGANAYITKPVRLKHLVHLIQKHLEPSDLPRSIPPDSIRS